MALFAIISFALTSCGNDDEPDTGGDLIGTWEWDSFNTDETEDIFGKQYIQFGSDGQYIEVDIDDGFGSEEEVDIKRGQWKQSVNTITVSGEGLITVTAKITELTDTDLTIVVLGLSMSYKRVDDSIIENYL